MRNRWMVWFSLVVVVLATAAFGFGNLWFGDLNQDEGWYLYAARMIWQGSVPYRDYFFTQGPMLPCVYGSLYGLWGNWGVAGGRLLTLLFGVIGTLLAAWAAARVVPRRVRMHAVLTVVAILGCNVYHSYFTTIVKTYGLATLFTGGAALALVGIRGKMPRVSAAMCGFFLAAAAGTRLSLGLMLCVVGGYLLALNNDRQTRGCWLWFGVGGALVLTAIFVPFVLAAPEGFFFAQSFHGARLGGVINPLYVAGFLARWSAAYLVGFCAGLWLIIERVAGKAPREGAPEWVGWLAMAGSVTLLQMFSPFPYDDYQVPLMPLFAAAVGALVWQRIASSVKRGKHAPMLLFIVLSTCIVSVGSPLTQQWVMLRHDRFWVEVKEESSLQRLRRVGRWVRQNSTPDETILTQDTYIAVEAQRNVPEGFEMGPFGFFPELDHVKAKDVKVLDRAAMNDLLERDMSPIALISGYGLAIAAPEMNPVSDAERTRYLQLLESRFKRLGCVPDFGQAATKLEIFVQPYRDYSPLSLIEPSESQQD